jgi:hypothetical protein
MLPVGAVVGGCVGVSAGMGETVGLGSGRMDGFALAVSVLATMVPTMKGVGVLASAKSWHAGKMNNRRTNRRTERVRMKASLPEKTFLVGSFLQKNLLNFGTLGLFQALLMIYFRPGRTTKYL